MKNNNLQTRLVKDAVKAVSCIKQETLSANVGCGLADNLEDNDDDN